MASRFCARFGPRPPARPRGVAGTCGNADGWHRLSQRRSGGEIIPASEAHRIGLVNRVVPVEELDALVADWAGRLAAGPPLAMDMTLRMLNQGLGSSLEEALEVEAIAQSVNIASRDTMEAVKAFLEKRTPVFRGRWGEVGTLRRGRSVSSAESKS